MEANKLSDLRSSERKRTSGKATLLLKNGSDDFESFQLYLKDISRGGLCGSYLGIVEQLFKGKLFLKGQGAHLHPVRMVWYNKSVDLIYMVGFKYLADAIPDSSLFIV